MNNSYLLPVIVNCLNNLVAYLYLKRVKSSHRRWDYFFVLSFESKSSVVFLYYGWWNRRSCRYVFHQKKKPVSWKRDSHRNTIYEVPIFFLLPESQSSVSVGTKERKNGRTTRSKFYIGLKLLNGGDDGGGPGPVRTTRD